MKEIPVKTTVTKYEAFDGTRFDTESECKFYESSQVGMLIEQLKSAIINKFDDLMLFSDMESGEQFNKFYTVLPRTRHDVFVLGQIMKAANDDYDTPIPCDVPLVLCLDIECNLIMNAAIINIEEWVSTMTGCMFNVVDCTDRGEDSKEEVKK